MITKFIFEDDDEEETLEHMGVRGMKWGIRNTSRQVNQLSKNVDKTVKRFDRGKDVPKDQLNDLSKKVRTQKSKVDRKVKKAEKFIIKHDKANAKSIINRYNKSPEKKAAVDDYIKSLKLNSMTLAEMRLQLMDIRL